MEHALERLAALRLIRRADDSIHPLPALARFGLAAPTLPSVTEGLAVSCLPAPARERWQPLRWGSSISSTTTTRSSLSATGGCCCAATTAPASRRCWR